MRKSVRRFGFRLAAAVVGALVAASTLAASPSMAEDDPLFIGWTDYLPSFTSGYEPSSENDCKAGRIQCVDAVIREMYRRYDPLLEVCSHNAMFALTYLRTTEQYRASATTEGFFSDPGFINHQDAVFARYYFDAWDGYYHPNGSTGPVSDSWRIAFQQADGRRVNGTGSMLLGMSAHVNRDLPLVLASIGLVKPDGSSRKPDHDKVNQFLNQVIEPLIDEAAARLDPTVDDAQVDGTTMDETALLQLLVSWREMAWRNAERIVSAPDEAARQEVIASIERQAAIEAWLIVAATSYSPLNANAALDQLAALGADPARLLQASEDRLVNVARGLLNSLFVDAADVRDAYCHSRA
ncbi:MAG: DUF5995 family protein [Acidimicrobiia bacterium]